MPKKRKQSIIETARVVQRINRAGRHAGITAIAKLMGVSRPRCKLLIQQAISEHLIYAYGNIYRNNSNRTCWSITECGCEVIYAIEQFKVRMLVVEEIVKDVLE